MRHIIFVISFLLLLGCNVDTSQPLSPAECRAYGVNVQDDDTITGEILISEFGTLGKMYKECGDNALGCAKPTSGDKWPASDHKYAIYYSERKCAPYHEACHAYYEEWNHTVKFNLRIMQGDGLAACP